MHHAIVTLFAVIGVLANAAAFGFVGFVFGWAVCSSYVKARISGKKPIDDYWARQGLRRRECDTSAPAPTPIPQPSNIRPR